MLYPTFDSSDDSDGPDFVNDDLPDCDLCPIPSPTTIWRERMIRDDCTQPPDDEPYSDSYWGDEE